MALEKIIQHETGTFSQYWRIVRVDLNYLTRQSEVVLLGYVSDQARLANMKNLDSRNFSISDQDFDNFFNHQVLDQSTNPVRQSYLYIKGTPEFIGSVDI